MSRHQHAINAINYHLLKYVIAHNEKDITSVVSNLDIGVVSLLNCVHWRIYDICSPRSDKD